MEVQNFTQRVKNVISKAYIKIAFQMIDELLEKCPNLAKKVLQYHAIKYEYQDLIKAERLGTISYKEVTPKKNKIILKLLEVVELLETWTQEDKAIRLEFEGIEEDAFFANPKFQPPKNEESHVEATQNSFSLPTNWIWEALIIINFIILIVILIVLIS